MLYLLFVLNLPYMYTKQLSTFRIKTMVISYEYLTQYNNLALINIYHAHVRHIVYREKYISNFRKKYKYYDQVKINK